MEIWKPWELVVLTCIRLAILGELLWVAWMYLY